MVKRQVALIVALLTSAKQDNSMQRLNNCSRKPTVETYRQDKHYPRVVAAMTSILTRGDIVEAVDVFIEMKLLSKENYENWRRGRAPYLEAVVNAGLGKLSTILRLIGFHAHDLKMVPCPTVYHQWGKGRKRILRFSKTGIKRMETVYSRNYKWSRSAARKVEMITALGAIRPTGTRKLPEDLDDCCQEIIAIMEKRIPGAKDSWSSFLAACSSDGTIDARAFSLLEDLIKTYVSSLPEAQKKLLWKDTETAMLDPLEEGCEIVFPEMDLEIELLVRVMDQAKEEITCSNNAGAKHHR